MKNKKKTIRLFLDIIMLIISLTLYNKRIISMKYHEIAGLALIAVILVHIFINLRTMASMTKNYLKIPLSVKICLVTDILLIVSYLFIGISGVLISKTILTSISSDNMILRTGHFFFSALSVILLGVHIGLHIARKPIKNALAIILTVIFLSCGIYGIANTSEIRMLSMPFASASGMQNHGGAPGQSGQHDGNHQSRDEANHDFEHQKNFNPDKESDKTPPGIPEGKKEFGGNPQDNKQNSMNASARISNIISYLGMIMSFAFITYWIVILKKKRPENKPAVIYNEIIQ